MKKPVIRFVTLILAVLLVLGLFSSVLAMIVSAAPNDATLSALKISVGALSPAFSSGTTTYTASVANSVSSIDITPTVSDANAKVKINGVAATSGAAKTLDLYVGKNSIDIDVTSADTTATKTYTVTVTRAAASAAGSDPFYKIITADTKISQTLTAGKVTSNITVTFNFLPDNNIGVAEGEYTFEDLSMPADSSFGWTTKTKLKIESVSKNNNIDYYRATLSNVTYTGGSSRILELYVYEEYWFSVPISSKFFKESSSEGDGAPTPDIIVQSVTVKNAAGQKLESVDKDTPPFTVEVVYYDAGLVDEPKEQIKAAKIHAFVTSATGFKTLTGTGGTVEILTSSAPYPRFRATFSNIQSDGTSRSMNFRVQYDFPEYEKSAKGEAAAVLFQVSTEEEGKEAGAIKPNIIVKEYSYGSETIVAGDEFKLDMKLCNTNKDTGVENVVMTIEPGSGFVIAAASNTVYFPSVAAGETVPYSIALRAAASGNTAVGGVAGAQTDYSVTVKFSYQYLAKKAYETGETSVKIAIPVIQLDRFSVEEITDYSQYMIVGEEGYISVPINNKGKSPTYNISGSVKAADEASFVAPVVNFGNLEAGKSGTVDLSIIINVPGEFKGEALISYEDEDMHQKHLTVPFSIMVDQPYAPPPEMPPEAPSEANSAGPGILSIIFCAVGALLIAAPIALYSIKRVKARGNEDIDEDF